MLVKLFTSPGGLRKLVVVLNIHEKWMLPYENTVVAVVVVVAIIVLSQLFADIWLGLIA